MTVVLRPMREQDLPNVLAWRNAEGVRKNMYTTHIIAADEHRNWWTAQSVNPRTRLLIAELNGSPAGVVTFTHYSGPGGVATWAFYAGDDAPKGLGSQMEAAALEYAFGALALRKLECEVLDFNMPVVNLHLRHGFAVEGIFRRAYERDGAYFDIYRLALFAEDWNKHVAPMLRAAAPGAKAGWAGKAFQKRVELSAERVSAFVQATDDRNPVHLDDAAAKRLGFPARISHGMLAGSLFSAVFANEFPGPGTIYLSQQLEFLSPVLVGATVDLQLKVLSHVGRRLLVETLLLVEEKLCIRGQASLLLPKQA